MTPRSATALATQATALVSAIGVDPAVYAIVKSQVAPPQCPDEAVALYFARCKQVGADPMGKMLYIVNRRSKTDGQYVDNWRIESYIDFFRSAAVGTGEYDGQEGPQWCGDDGVWLDEWLRDMPPTAARIKVFRKGVTHVPWTVARFNAYYGSGSNFLEKKLGEVLIAKVAEALAIRRAFPQQLAGIYTAEEMKQADDSRTVYPTGITPGADEPSPAALPETAAGEERAAKAAAALEKPDGKALRKAYDTLQMLGESRSMGHYLFDNDQRWMRPGAKPLKERSTAKVLLSGAETEAAYTIVMDDIAKRRNPETLTELADHSAVRNAIEGEIVEESAGSKERTIADEVRYCHECGAQTNPADVAEPHEATCSQAVPALPKPTDANIALLRTEMKRLHGKDTEAVADWLYALLGASSVEEIAEKGTDADCLLAIKQARAARVEDNIATS